MAIEPLELISRLEDDLRANSLHHSGGDFWPGMSVNDAAAVSIRNSLLKKFCNAVAPEADERARDKFLACNQQCKDWTEDLRDEKLEIILGSVKQILDDFWHRDGLPLSDHPFDALERGRVGPGVNLGASGESFYAKLFSSTLTCSRLSLYHWYRRYVWSFPDWSNAELIRKEQFGEARVVPSSKLSFVPKNDEISRCICIEPSLNTYYQLGFGSILEDRLRERFGISFDVQPSRNRNLARLGSLNDDLSTIDLSSASDSISRKMLKCILPHSFIKMLDMYRSDFIEVKGVGSVELHMVSTMGNGFTFPLQTMIFCAVVVACLRWRDIPAHCGDGPGNWAVFGDDIICPKSCTQDVITVLNYLGFRVNDDKTFAEGPFRESCGVDYYQGVNIRGVYIKDLSTDASLYSAINQLFRFSARTGISLESTIWYLHSSLKRRLYVPISSDISSGIQVPLSLNPFKSYDKKRMGYPFRLLVAKARKVLIRDGYCVVPRGKQRLIYNPDGLLIAFLQGSIHSSSYAVRTNRVHWKEEPAITSSWGDDRCPLSVPDGSVEDWGRWISALHEYFMQL